MSWPPLRCCGRRRGDHDIAPGWEGLAGGDACGGTYEEMRGRGARRPWRLPTSAALARRTTASIAAEPIPNADHAKPPSVLAVADTGGVHEGLRSYLQREVPPERVWRALEAAMLGSNEAARVSASKVLIDALSEGRDTCPVCAKTAAVDVAEVRVKLETQLQHKLDATDRAVEERAEQLAQERTQELEGQLAALRAEHALA